MLIGYSLTIPNFFGQQLTVDKILANPEVSNPEILASKENPVQFFLLKKPRDFASILSDVNFVRIPVKYEAERNIFGFEFSNYACNKAISSDCIASQFDNDCIGFTQQIHWGKIVVNITKMFKPLNRKGHFVNEIHINPIDQSLPLLYTHESEFEYDLDVDCFSDAKSFIAKVKASRSYRELSSFGITSPDYDSEANIDEIEFLRKEYSSDLSYYLNTVLTRNWTTKRQAAIDLKEFVEKSRAPVITPTEKEAYLIELNKFGSYHYGDSINENDFFFPTYINWAGNFYGDMVLVSVEEGVDYEGTECMRIYFSGNDDCAYYFFIDYFKNTAEFLSFLKGRNKGVITDEVIDFMRENALSWDT